MEVLTNAPVVTVVLGGKPRQLLFGFRCWKHIGVNPFDSASREAYFGQLDVEKAAGFIVAAIENWAAYARLVGETPPTEDVLAVDQVIDLLDMRTFGDIVAKLKTAGDGAEDSKPGASGEATAADPRAA